MQTIDIIGRNWKLTLPTGKNSKPDEIKMPALAASHGRLAVEMERRFAALKAAL